MISKSTIDQIVETARIEEVVGEYVPLKKRGANFIGCCPFHGEKTPSFNVNPARNIFKCFGCGEGGSVITFLMKHEGISYPEALRKLAARYNIEVEETVPSPEEQQVIDEKESLYVLNSFAQKSFSEQLLETEEGKSIALSYLKERAISMESIEKFQLGYSLADASAFAKLAVKSGYEEKYLEKTGLCFRTDRGQLIDRFRGRVIFPIHTVSGRISGFGGRILKKDDKIAKYVNSSASDIYNKSTVLYGIFQAKKSIQKNNCCYITEGYLDVISFHQAGIENIVAPCGTALTELQVKSISRYTNNIVLIFDGDPAGINATIKAIDIILPAGINLKVVLLPDGNDADDFARKNGGSFVKDYIAKHAKDAIIWKTEKLIAEHGDDPVKKTEAVKELIATLSLISDAILRSNYTKKCSALLEMNEATLISEINKIIRKQITGKSPETENNLAPAPTPILKPQQPTPTSGADEQEKNIIRLLLNFGHLKISFPEEFEDENGATQIKNREYSVARFIVEEIALDNIRFEHPVYDMILGMYARLPEKEEFLNVNQLLQSNQELLRNAAVELLSPRYELSENWHAMHGIHVTMEEHDLKKTVEQSVLHLKKQKVIKMLEENMQLIKEAQQTGQEYDHLVAQQQKLENIKTAITSLLKIDILR